MRNKTVTVNGKDVVVQERRIGELKALIASLVPGSGGNLANVDISNLMEIKVDDLLYKKLPEVFPGLTPEDVDNAYMSDVESLVEAFIDVHFLGLKRLVIPMMNLAQTGTVTKSVPISKTPTSAQVGTTRKR